MSDMEHKSTTYDFVMSKGTWGFAYEADEVARCLRAVKLWGTLAGVRMVM
jgi:hypothetical protein